MATTRKKTTTKSRAVVRELEHDTDKKLKNGKRRYAEFDEEGRIVKSEYLDGDEVEQLGSPDNIKVTITAT